MRYTAAMRPAARLRKLCLALPEASEVEQFGGPTYRVRNKIFAMQAGGADQVWFKAEPGVQPALVGSDPDRWFVPPYVGSKGWVGATFTNADWDHLTDLVEESYRLVAPKKLSKLLDGLG